MQAIPIPVTNVQLFPYIDAPIQVQPIFIDGTGTYSVGTLTTHIFYNLDLSSGTSQHGGVHAGNKYFAVARGPDGESINTPWMTCTRGGEEPQLGRTIDALGGGSPADVAAPSRLGSDIVYQLHLQDVRVSLYHDPLEPIEIVLIEGATAVATFAGLLPGGSWSVVVSGGQRVNPLSVGARVCIQGRLANSGKPFFVPAVLSTTDAGDPARFAELRR